MVLLRPLLPLAGLLGGRVQRLSPSGLNERAKRRVVRRSVEPVGSCSVPPDQTEPILSALHKPVRGLHEPPSVVRDKLMRQPFARHLPHRYAIPNESRKADVASSLKQCSSRTEVLQHRHRQGVARPFHLPVSPAVLESFTPHVQYCTH